MAYGSTPAFGMANPSDTRGVSRSSEDLESHCGNLRETHPGKITDNHSANRAKVADAVGIECANTNFFGRTITSANVAMSEEFDIHWAPKAEFAGAAGAIPDGEQVLMFCDELNTKMASFVLTLTGKGTLPSGFSLGDKGKLINTQMAGFVGLPSASNAAFLLNLPAGDRVLDEISDNGKNEEWREWTMAIRVFIANADPTGQASMLGPGGNVGAPYIATQILAGELTSARFTMTNRTVTLNEGAPATIDESLDEYDDVTSNA